jgi:uncharacterized RDD family membrane protein YckC
MPTHNPYVAWMYEKYGQLDPASKTIIESFDQLQPAFTHQAYLLSLVVKDKLDRQPQQLDRPSQQDGFELVRAAILWQLIDATQTPFQQAVKDEEKATFIAEALHYHILGRLVDSPVHRTEEPNQFGAPTSVLLDGSFASHVALVFGNVLSDSDDRLVRGLCAQINAVADDIVRQVLYGEVPPLRRTEDFIAEPPESKPPEIAAVSEVESPLKTESPPNILTDHATAFPGLCRYCGVLVASGEDVCKKCGNWNRVPEDSAGLRIYATMTQRLCAYLADYVLIYFLVLATFVVLGFVGSPLASDESLATGVALLALFLYMITAQTSYHTTVGKYIAGIEVVNELPNRKYPTWGRLLLRETVGRLCNFFFWGAGYWTAIRHPFKQAWSDRMSGTLVVARPTNKIISRGLTAFVLVALVIDVGVTAYGSQEQERQKRYAAFSKELKTLGGAIETSRKNIEVLVGAEAKDLDAYRGQMREMTTWLDRYDADTELMEQAIRKALSEGTISSTSEKQQMETLLRLWDVRKRQSQRRRDEAQLVFGYTPGPGSVNRFETEMKMIDSDIDGLEHQAAQLVSEIQKQ